MALLTRPSRTTVRRGLALLGYTLAVLAIAFEEHRVGWVAIGLLVASLLLRVVDRRAPSSDDRPSDSQE
jgi:hypothetical protein